MVGGRSDAEAFHLVKERGAFQAESGGCSARTAEIPICALTGGEDLLTDFVFQRRVRNLDWSGVAFLGPLRSENAVVGKDYAAGDVVLQLANVSGP